MTRKRRKKVGGLRAFMAERGIEPGAFGRKGWGPKETPRKFLARVWVEPGDDEHCSLLTLSEGLRRKGRKGGGHMFSVPWPGYPNSECLRLHFNGRQLTQIEMFDCNLPKYVLQQAPKGGL